MHEAEKATVALHQFQDAVARRPVSGVSAKKADNGCWQLGRNNVEHLAGAFIFFVARDENEGLQRGVILCCESTNGLGQPFTRLVNDHDGHHGGQGSYNIGLCHALARLVGASVSP